TSIRQPSETRSTLSPNLHCERGIRAMEQFRWLAAVIAAHPGRQVTGRTRLQKTMKLLQRLGLPTSYSFTLHFYGPYSEGIQSDISLLEHLDLVKEEEHKTQDGLAYYLFCATALAESTDIQPFRPMIELMSKT